MTLIIPDGFDRKPPEIEPVGPNACIYARTACANIESMIDQYSPGRDPEELPEQLTIAHNDIANKCALLCSKGCRVRAALIADSVGLELPYTIEEEALTTVVLYGALLENPEQEGLTNHAQHVKSVVEKRREVFFEENSEDGSAEALGYPEISDDAYQVLTDVTRGNFNIILSVLGHLSSTGKAQQLEDVLETSEQHKVLLDDPRLITEKEVMLLLAHPDLQYQFYLQSKPRGTW